MVLQRVDSTNALARRVMAHRSALGLPNRAAIFLAWEQTRGRGRLGRPWSSPGGGVYVSRLVPVRSAAELSLLPIRAPTALCRALREFVDAPCRLKWPNDLLVGGRKIGGVLVEALSEGSRPRAAVVGFGINHGPVEADDGAAGVTWMQRESASPPSPAKLALALIAALEEELAGPSEPAGAVAAYRDLCVHRRGEWIRCRSGEQTVEGRFRDIDEAGFLLLDSDGGVRRVAAGELVESGAKEP